MLIADSIFLHPLGQCAGNIHEVLRCRSYNFWSGIGSDFGEITLVTAVVALLIGFWTSHNCHRHRCLRLSWHTDREGHPICKVHHPNHPARGWLRVDRSHARHALPLVTANDKHQAVFGGFDSICSLMGLVLALAIQHGASTALTGGVAGAIGAALSMGIGEYLGDGESELRPALVMGHSTLGFGLLPSLPLLAGSGTLPVLACLAVSLLLCAIVARLRPETFWPSVAKTYGGFVVCVGLATGATLLVS